MEKYEIVYFYDDKNNFMTSVSLFSLLINQKNLSKINVNIVMNEKTNKNNLIKLSKKFNIEFNYIIGKPSLLYLQDLLSCEKVLYLSNTTIVLDDLTELFETKFDENYAGVLDFNINNQSINNKYICTDVCILNLKQIREHNLTKIYEQSENNLNDQQLINLKNKDNYILKLRYNYWNCVMNNEKKMVQFSKLFNLKEYNYIKIFNTQYNFSILNYVGGQEPWKTTTKYYEIWKKYYDLYQSLIK